MNFQDPVGPVCGVSWRHHRHFVPRSNLHTNMVPGYSIVAITTIGRPRLNAEGSPKTP